VAPSKQAADFNKSISMAAGTSNQQYGDSNNGETVTVEAIEGAAKLCWVDCITNTGWKKVAA
jgi:hypothetical protein